MKLNYIDDIVTEFIRALNGCPTPAKDGFYSVLPQHEVTLGEIVQRLTAFRDARETLNLPDGSDAFAKKLYATYLSFLPEDGFAYQPVSHALIIVGCQDQINNQADMYRTMRIRLFFCQNSLGTLQ